MKSIKNNIALYLLFVMDNKHPQGGMGDFCGRFYSTKEIYDFLSKIADLGKISDRYYVYYEDAATYDIMNILEIKGDKLKLLLVDVYVDDYLAFANPLTGEYVYTEKDREGDGGEDKDFLEKKFKRAMKHPAFKPKRFKNKMNIQEMHGDDSMLT